MLNQFHIRFCFPSSVIHTEKKYDLSGEGEIPREMSEKLLPQEFREMLKPSFPSSFDDMNQALPNSDQEETEDEKDNRGEGETLRDVYERTNAQTSAAMKLSFESMPHVSMEYEWNGVGVGERDLNK